MVRFFKVGALVLSLLTLLSAADWPQYRGPERTGVSLEKGLLKKWPEGGPKLLWTCKDAGNGYSGPAIVGDVLYTMGGRGGIDYLLALDVQTGKEKWAAKIGPSFDDQKQFINGPSATPTVDKEAIYALSGAGDLASFDLAGKPIWSVNLPKTMKAKVNPIFAKEDSQGWGFCWSPLVDGDKLIITPGGPDGLFAALDKKTGKLLWSSKEATDQCTYASPIVAEVAGVRQYIAIVQNGAVGFDAKTGALLWRYKRKPAAFADVVCATPIYQDNFLFLSAKGGSDLVELSKSDAVFSAKKKVTTRDFQNFHGGVVLFDKYLYGSHLERSWQALEFANPTVTAWESAGGADVATGSLTCADGLLYAYSEKEGNVALIEATPKAFNQISLFKLPEASKIRPVSGQFWTHPVVSNGRLYLRDQELIFCYEVK